MAHILGWLGSEPKIDKIRRAYHAGGNTNFEWNYISMMSLALVFSYHIFRSVGWLTV